MNRRTAILVERGYDDAYETLLREFGRKGFTVFWDRRFQERRHCDIPVEVERRVNQRRHDSGGWSVQHFRVITLRE